MIFAPTKAHMHILFPRILQCIAINRKVMYHELIQKEIKIEYLLLITFQMTQIIILFHVKSSFCDLHDVNVKTTVDLLRRALKQNWVLSCHTFAVVLNWYFKKNKQDVTTHFMLMSHSDYYLHFIHGHAFITNWEFEVHVFVWIMLKISW